MAHLIKKIALVAVSAIALLAISACGGGDASPTPVSSGPIQTPNPTPAPTPPPTGTRDFSAVTQAIEGYADDDFAVLIGTVDGELYSYTKGNFGLDEQFAIASASKWLTSATIMQLVDKGILSLSDSPQDHLSFWTVDLMDPRSSITLEQLLSFISGFNQTPGSLNCTPAVTVTVSECVQQIYNDGLDTKPGSGFSYGPEHMQIAAAMAEAATGARFAEIVRTELVEPLGMSSATGFVSPTTINPLASGGAASTAQDYALFLTALLREELVSDTDAFLADRIGDTPVLFRPRASNDFGDWHYALGAFVECDKPTFDTSCAEDATHSSPGSFGWTPWIDQRNGYWGLIARRGARNSAPVAVELEQILQPLIVEALAD
ncbi:serine hydrolase [uncultured Erythrobacter sp.]|uniref:serine hydrolase domain-containing protein n=1 Tax=uncultured Erythrobacter sp. TaxID=263913 RepID=UPI00262E5F6E|nr:serine hydrolase domain-containing protein [uncultured Erythrobacter sp.]